MEIKEALGCIAIVCGHNSSNPNPLLSFVLHLFGAIASGNTVVIVPDEKFPTLALDLIEVFETSDMPPGVVNILSGSELLWLKCVWFTPSFYYLNISC